MLDFLYRHFTSVFRVWTIALAIAMAIIGYFTNLSVLLLIGVFLVLCLLPAIAVLLPMNGENKRAVLALEDALDPMPLYLFSKKANSSNIAAQINLSSALYEMGQKEEALAVLSARPPKRGSSLMLFFIYNNNLFNFLSDTEKKESAYYAAKSFAACLKKPREAVIAQKSLVFMEGELAFLKGDINKARELFLSVLPEGEKKTRFALTVRYFLAACDLKDGTDEAKEKARKTLEEIAKVGARLAVGRDAAALLSDIS